MPSDTGQPCKYGFGDVHFAMPGSTKTFGGAPIADVRQAVSPERFTEYDPVLYCDDCKRAVINFTQRIMPIIEQLYKALVGEEPDDAEPC